MSEGKQDTLLKVKIGVFGSDTYENKNKIRKILFDFNKKYPNTRIIGRGGDYGADKHIKRYALELGLDYSEFNLAHTNKTSYSVMEYNYFNKTYSGYNFIHRDKLFIGYVSSCIIFSRPTDDNKSILECEKLITKLHKKSIYINI